MLVNRVSTIIYTDDQMFDYVKANYDKEIFTYFERINTLFQED